MTFVDAVRRGKVKAPQQHGYSELHWSRVFHQHKDGTEQDERLHESGLWFGRRFASARAAWIALPRLPYKPPVLARLFVGLTNFQTSHAAGDILHRSETESTNFDGYSKYVREVTDTSERLQHAIESLRIPLSNALKGIESGDPLNAETSETEALFTGLAQRNSLRQQYAGLERLWADCIWNGWYVEEDNDTDIIVPSDTEREIWRAASHFRRDSLLTEMAYHTRQAWINASVRQRQAWADAPVVTSVKRHAKRLILEVGMMGEFTTDPPFSWIARIAASEEYLDGILDDPLPSFEQLTIRELLSAYWLLAPLSRLLAGPALSMEVLESLADVESCAPRLDADDCANALARGLGVTPARGHAIVRALTFDGTARDEPWLKPFVPLDGSWLTVLFEPLRTLNLLWAIDSWLRRGGLNMSARGPAFEGQLRDNLAASAKLDGTDVVSHAITLSGEGGEEEIDIVVRVGNTILVGEAKCSVYPTEPFEFTLYEEILEGGAAQARRKADFTIAHLRELTELLGWSDIDVSRANVVPVVITNLPLGAALPNAAASVTDFHILRRFLAEGSMQKFIEISPNGTQKAAMEVKFYHSPEEAERNIEAYLANPPQLAELRQLAKVSFRPIFFFPGERPASYVAIHCDPFDIMREHVTS